MTAGAPAAAPLGVMTFNTGNDLITAGDLVSVIAGTGAAITGLQELSPANAAALQTSLHTELPYRVIFGEYFNGKALLSRYPLLAHEWFEVTSGRAFLEVKLAIQGREVTVFVVHPPPPDPRLLEVAASAYSVLDVSAILERADLATPTLLIGDFNFVPANRSYRLLRDTGLIDTFRAAGRGPGLTYPVRHEQTRIPLPRMMRLDYIWATHHFRTLSSHVLRAPGSDHRPVVSVLSLESES